MDTRVPTGLKTLIFLIIYFKALRLRKPRTETTVYVIWSHCQQTVRPCLHFLCNLYRVRPNERAKIGQALVKPVMKAHHSCFYCPLSTRRSVVGTLESCGCCLITLWESDLSLSGGKHGPHTEQSGSMHVYVCVCVCVSHTQRHIPHQRRQVTTCQSVEDS